MNSEIYEWARGYDPALRLNALVEKVGDKALITSAASPARTYIDGSQDVQANFSLVMMAPWSEGADGLNQDALEEGQAWLDWVREQERTRNYPALEGVLEVGVDDEAPILAQVMEGALWAKYQFQAHVIFRRAK